MNGTKEYQCDVLVIGGGLAGLFAAINAREEGCRVILADKAAAGRSGASIMASGQLNVFNPQWGTDIDTAVGTLVRDGQYLNHRLWLRTMLEESWSVYENMRDWGVEFPCPEEEFPTYMAKLHGFITPEGEPKTGTDAAPVLGMIPLKHREVPVKLRRWGKKQGIEFLDRVMITELIKTGDTVTGAAGFTQDGGEEVIITAGAVVMAAGKNGFRASGMNVAELTGDGDAMAYEAGAIISGKEFPDLHTGLARHTAWKGTGEIYPAFWRYVDCGGALAGSHGFDLSAAAMVHAGRGPIMWDFEHMTPEDEARIERYLRKRDMPHESERINLGYYSRKNEQLTGGAAGGSPAEQSAGIFPVDMNCTSTLPGLYAAGDCCSTWAWGAQDKGAPPGLLSAAVTGRHAGRGAAEYALEHGVPAAADRGKYTERIFAPLRRKGGFDPRWVCRLLQGIMLPYYVLHIKSEERLNAALVNVEFLREHMSPRLKANDLHELRLCHETRSMILNAEMILRASLLRRESRGWHYREDYPFHDDNNWLAWVLLRRGDGGMTAEKLPLPERWLAEDPSEKRYDRPSWDV